MDIIGRLKQVPGKVGFYMKDLVTGETMGYNEDGLYQAASVIKLPIYAVIMKLAHEGKLSLSEAEAELNAIDRMKRITRLQEIGAAGGSAGFFALMFGGNWFDLLAAGVCGALAKAVLGLLPDEDGMPVTSAVAGFMAAILGHALSKYTGMGNVDRIIVSTLMPFLPGLAFTNGIRDGMNGDLISGNARIGDAITRAIVLAGGAGAGLWLWMRLTGGVL